MYSYCSAHIYHQEWTSQCSWRNNCHSSISRSFCFHKSKKSFWASTRFKAWSETWWLLFSQGLCPASTRQAQRFPTFCFHVRFCKLPFCPVTFDSWHALFTSISPHWCMSRPHFGHVLFSRHFRGSWCWMCCLLFGGSGRVGLRATLTIIDLHSLTRNISRLQLLLQRFDFSRQLIDVVLGVLEVTETIPNFNFEV